MSPKSKPRDSGYAERVRRSFGEQKLMTTIGAELVAVEPGEVVIELPYREDLTQQDRFIHAGIITAIADSACGYAAYTLMPADSRVLSVEYKINLMAPAAGERFVAKGRVKKAGRTLTVAAGDVSAITGDGLRPIATMLATLISLD